MQCPTSEVVAFSTAQHAVASLYGVAARLHGDQRAAIASNLLELSTLYDVDERAPSDHGDNHQSILTTSNFFYSSFCLLRVPSFPKSPLPPILYALGWYFWRQRGHFVDFIAFLSRTLSRTFAYSL